jgi:DNA-directed RNA polymerase specialized sigma24 family protein
MGDIYSEIIYLRESFDMDYDEIENFLGVPSSTCRSRNRRAVKALRRNLVEEYGAEQFFS